jgi:hypothetical protein
MLGAVLSAPRESRIKELHPAKELHALEPNDLQRGQASRLVRTMRKRY